MHPGIYGSVDVVECKGHHYTTPEKNVVDNGLWREGEQGERQGGGAGREAGREAGSRGGGREKGRKEEGRKKEGRKKEREGEK